MNHMYDGGTYFGWGWILWFAFIFLVISSFGNWGYAYRAHRKVDGSVRKDASSIMNERYARGEIDRTQYLQMKADLAIV